MLGLVGVIEIEDKVAAVTVKTEFPEILPDVAEMVVLPTATDVARPLVLIEATAAFDEAQVTCEVKSCIVLSEKVPVAVNCLVVPLATLGLEGVTAMDTRVADVTVRVVLPEILPDVAVMVVVPIPNIVVNPFDAEASLNVAFAVSKEPHTTDVVKSCVLLSEYIPVAVNCRVVPRALLAFAGVIDIEARIAELVVPLSPLPLLPPPPAPQPQIPSTMRRYIGKNLPIEPSYVL